MAILAFVLGSRQFSPRVLRNFRRDYIVQLALGDASFGFRELVDIAERAGSNDPTTAIQAIDSVHDLLRRLASRPDPSGNFADEAGVLRLVVPTPSFDDFLALTVDELAFYGAGDLRVPARLRTMLLDLLEAARPEHRASIEQRLQALNSSRPA